MPVRQTVANMVMMARGLTLTSYTYQMHIGVQTEDPRKEAMAKADASLIIIRKFASFKDSSKVTNY